MKTTPISFPQVAAILNLNTSWVLCGTMESIPFSDMDNNRIEGIHPVKQKDFDPVLLLEFVTTPESQEVSEFYFLPGYPTQHANQYGELSPLRFWPYYNYTYELGKQHLPENVLEIEPNKRYTDTIPDTGADSDFSRKMVFHPEVEEAIQTDWPTVRDHHAKYLQFFHASQGYKEEHLHIPLHSFIMIVIRAAGSRFVFRSGFAGRMW